MASRKEERERLRQARIESEQRKAKEQRRRLFVGYGIAGVLGLVVIVGIVVVIASSGSGASGAAHINVNQTAGSTNGVPPDDRKGIAPPPAKVTNLKLAAKKAGCVLRLGLPDEGHTHVSPGTTVHYKTKPPTSGNHVEPPYQQADGAYKETPDAIDFVHSLEHGRLEIEYQPTLPEQQQLELKGLYDTLYSAALLFPQKDMPYQVAAVTWTNLLGCKVYKGPITLDAIRAFGKKTWGKYGGEPVQAFTPVTGPTPANPSK